MKKAINHCLVFVFILFGSCSLFESEEEKREGEAVELDNQDLNLSIFEIVTINLPEGQFTNGEIEGTVEGENIELTISDNTLTFMVPKLNQGSYKLIFQEKNKPYNIAFQVKAHSLKETPANYIQTYLDKSQMQVERLEKTKNLLVGEKKIELEKDIAVLKKFLDEQYAKAALLKEDELADMAFFIEANKEWMDELSAAVNELNVSFPNARIAGEVVTNIEALGNRVSGKYVAAVMTVVKHIPKIVSALTIGYLTGSIFGPLGSSLGAAIGLGISLGNLLLDLEELLGSIDAVANFVQVVADNIMEVNLKTLYSFQNNESTELFVSRNYRTVYSGDLNSTVPFVRDFMGGIKTLIAEWQKIISKIPLDLVFTPTDYSAISTYQTTNQRVHSDHLSISGITNPKVSGSVTKEEGRLLVKMSTAAESEETFKFNLVYDNADFGKLTETNDGVINSKFVEITDPRDGKKYMTVKIGNQTWFRSNLRYVGNIPQVTSDEAWAAIWNKGNPTGQPAWAYYENKPENEIFSGKMYNWYAVANGNLCPPGWHVPTIQEWQTLIDFLGGRFSAGSKLKFPGGWSPDYFSTNSSGFTAFGDGVRYADDGKFIFQLKIGYWWSSSESEATKANALFMIYDSSSALLGSNFKATGMSCRCIKD
ncbi:FISUMP domain-containing protein [Aquiflexum gelatinilyticum]|uniref:Fibrobacter succinogenes major paralogous domain-containing protein n=1 Tax=Aquiflexum gelatinilyticum TaxID=2961943 RepID=A0A9X2T0G1_9BACT|nr:FISUMP domain-containing protein [Aquiflexum gelatinilyticum]MCR9015558.1 hypothetical protein [Aquiflexum gelatinilyticum]